MPERSVKRKLAAILAADVSGYSRLMGADEERTLRRLQRHHRELIDPKIREHGGRIVKTTGDGFLAEFPSVVDAVRCAVEVQRGMVERDAALHEDQRIRFRIGVNLGDIIVKGADVFGDGVNIAARLEALADPNGVCISGMVHDLIIDRLSYVFEDAGEQSVKNITRPLRVFGMSSTAIAATPLVPVREPVPRSRPERDAQPGSRRRASKRSAPPLSIIVLPFTNLSNDPEQEYFVDAITDDLTTDLSRMMDSFVISRTTAFTYKCKPVDVKRLGQELGVRYVLEGSVRWLGEQVQVNVQLIDAETGAHVWADRFNTDRVNLTKAQDEITSRLARTLDIALVQTAGRKIDPEINPDARDMIMRGWALYYSPQVHWQEAKEAFEKALKLDPQSTSAKIALARLLAEGIPRGLSKSREQDMARAEKLITEAVQWDAGADAYYALGLLHRLQNRLTESRSELEKAISLNPNHGSASLQLGISLLFSGEPELALPHLEKALRLTPNTANSHFYYFWLGFGHLLMNQSDRAVEYLRRACTAGAGAPQLAGYRKHLASALGLNGDIEEAKTTLAEARKLLPNENSMTDARSWFGNTGTLEFLSMYENTLEHGLRIAGMPEE